MIAALILAAGKGARFGSGSLPKQFAEIAGKPLFIHSVQTYVGIAEIDRVIVVANPQWLEQTTETLKRHELVEHVTVVVGGNTRQVSVQNAAGLIAEDGLNAQDSIILHNAASPNTSVELITRCLSAMSDSDAVQACVPDTRTISESDEQFIKRVLPRANLACHCDPTIYRGDVFKHVLETQKRNGLSGDTTSDTARDLGYSIRLVQSDYGNIKVTTRWDLAAVRAAMDHSLE